MKLGNKTLSIPIIQGGMGVGISLGNLAGAVAKEGGMGVLSDANPGYMREDFWTNSREANHIAMTEEIKKAKEIAGGNGLIGVNVMVAGVEYASRVKTVVDAGADCIISGAGLPLDLPSLVPEDVLVAPIVSSGKGAATICRAWKKRHNRLPDFIVIEGAKAGGHLGFKADEIETAKSLSEILKDVKEQTASYGDIPVFVAGGIFTSKEVADYVNEGAAGVQMATRFIATHECDASEAYKNMMVNATEEDVYIIKSPVGMPGRAIKTPLIDKLNNGERIMPKKCIRCLIPCDPATTPYCITLALIEAAKGNVEDGLFFCGANVGKVDKIVTVKELIDELLVDWRK